MIYIVSGDIESGKSTALLKCVKTKKNVYGILTPKDENHIRYFLDVHTQEKFAMEASSNASDVLLVGQYMFLAAAFKKANGIIKDAIEDNQQGYIIIDELGKLELRSEGLHQSALHAIQKTINNTRLHLILVVRKSLLKDIVEKYDIVNFKNIVIEQLECIFIKLISTPMKCKEN